MTSFSEFDKFLQKHFTTKELFTGFYKTFRKEKDVYRMEDGTPSNRRIEFVDDTGEFEIIIKDNPKLGEKNVRHKLAKKEIFQELMELNLFKFVSFQNIDFTDESMDYNLSEGYIPKIDRKILPRFGIAFENCKIDKLPADIFELELELLTFSECEINEFPLDAFKNSKCRVINMSSSKVNVFKETNIQTPIINEHIYHLYFNFLKIPFDKDFLFQFFDGVIYDNLRRLTISATSTYSLNALETRKILQSIPNAVDLEIGGQYKNRLDEREKKPVGLTDIDFSLIDFDTRLTYVELIRGLTRLPLGIENLKQLSRITLYLNKLTYNNFDFDRLNLLPKLHIATGDVTNQPEIEISDNPDSDRIAKRLREMFPYVTIYNERSS
jgi:hypothetical protein